MSFRDFSFPSVQQQLNLRLEEADLFQQVPARAVSAEFRERLDYAVGLALSICTEKARSEFIIAPVLIEVIRSHQGRSSLFSGVEFDVDPDRGLNGVCDFLLSRSPIQSVLSAPVIAIAEAKNDNIRTGLGQCISAMVAARQFNHNHEDLVPTIYGAVTTGASWKFLTLTDDLLTIDRREYFIAEIEKIIGILSHILETA